MPDSFVPPPLLSPEGVSPSEADAWLEVRDLAEDRRLVRACLQGLAAVLIGGAGALATGYLWMLLLGGAGSAVRLACEWRRWQRLGQNPPPELEAALRRWLDRQPDPEAAVRHWAQKDGHPQRQTVLRRYRAPGRAQTALAGRHA